MHQYLDSDGSGTNATCVSSTIGADRIADATSWLQQHNLKGFLGEIGAGSDGMLLSALDVFRLTNGSGMYSDVRVCGQGSVVLHASFWCVAGSIVVGSWPMVGQRTCALECPVEKWS